jgi:hypothetical protein
MAMNSSTARQYSVAVFGLGCLAPFHASYIDVSETFGVTSAKGAPTWITTFDSYCLTFSMDAGFPASRSLAAAMVFSNPSITEAKRIKAILISPVSNVF